MAVSGTSAVLKSSNPRSKNEVEVVCSENGTSVIAEIKTVNPGGQARVSSAFDCLVKNGTKITVSAL